MRITLLDGGIDCCIGVLIGGLGGAAAVENEIHIDLRVLVVAAAFDRR